MTIKPTYLKVGYPTTRNVQYPGFCLYHKCSYSDDIWIMWTTPAKFRVCLRFCALGLRPQCQVPMHKAHPEVGGSGPPYWIQ